MLIRFFMMADTRASAMLMPDADDEDAMPAPSTLARLRARYEIRAALRIYDELLRWRGADKRAITAVYADTMLSCCCYDAYMLLLYA